MKILKKIKKLRERKISLKAYLTLAICAVIVSITAMFTLYASSTIKNFAGKYETTIYNLRYSLAYIVIQSFISDTKNNNYDLTNNIIDILKKDKLLAYTFAKNDVTDKVILGMDMTEEEVQDANETTRQVSRTIGNNTLYFGIPIEQDTDTFMKGFVKIMLNTLITFLLLGIIISLLISKFISKPIDKVSKAAREIADGNFDVKLEETEFSELNNLVDTYNEMNFQLNELYSSLELKVQERTIALEAANYKLQETQAMMVHSEKMRSLGELVAGIAHEINNPVNFIHGNIQILQNYAKDLIQLISMYDDNIASLPEDVRAKITAFEKDIDLEFLKDDINDLIRSCQEGTERTKNIVLDLKNFSRMEEMILTQFDIPKEIDTTLSILNNKYKNRITVVKNYAENTPKIEAYGGQLNQVFMNILDNAQAAIENTGTLTINTYKVEQNVVIEFIDTGAGIAPENLKKVFDPFFTTKPVGKGTGLGMSISYRVINDHKGTIEVESEVGKGTKFTITLPINHNQGTLEEQIIQDLREENGVN